MSEDEHAGHDITVTQVWDEGECKSSKVHCDTCGVDLS